MSLKSLEVFQVCAARGSVQAAADETGLSISTVSHHLGRLEASLGVDLFDHSRRPIQLTQAGRGFLRRIDAALRDIRTAAAEVSSGDIENARYLRIGMIEDFDYEVAPKLAVSLAESMPRCDFAYLTESSHRIIRMLRNRELDIGVVAYATENLDDLLESPLLRDPFVVVAPKSPSVDPGALLRGETDFPFLRFTGDLLIGRQIEAQLRRLDVALPDRFSCANSNIMMTMVSAGAGWTISTALLYAHARQFRDGLQIHPFPRKAFARTLSVLSAPSCSRSVLDQVQTRLRGMLSDGAVPAIHAEAPWLVDGFRLID